MKKILNESSNHQKWFLKYHPNAIEDFKKEVERKYGHKIKNGSSATVEQPSLFDLAK